jgi:hypothetical protein
VIPEAAVEAAYEALPIDSYVAGPNHVRAMLEAAAPYLMAQAFDEGQKSGMRHTDRLVAAEKIGRPDLPGPLSPNPYRKDTE